MRLWHYKLIPVLPRKQLVAQWRECCAIASNIANNGTPNHVLVNKVLDYPQVHFTSYINRILKEMERRSYKVSEASYSKLKNNMEKGFEYFNNYNVEVFRLFPEWHSERYLTQCYYNLQEKYDCGMINKEEWEKVFKFYHWR